MRIVRSQNATDTEWTHRAVQCVSMEVAGQTLIQDLQWDWSIELILVVGCFPTSCLDNVTTIGQKSSEGLFSNGIGIIVVSNQNNGTLTMPICLSME